MKRISTRGIIFIGDKIALMHRIKKDNEYYTLPGGGLEVENDELLTDGVVREIYEEFGISIKPTKLSYVETNEKQTSYYFLCEYISGEFGSGQGEEYGDNRDVERYGTYEPQLIDIDKLNDLPLVPIHIKEELIKDINKFGKDLANDIKNLTIEE